MIAKHDLERMMLQRKLGATVSQAISATPTQLDTSPLVANGGYPMTLQITAESASAYVYQGDNEVAIPGSPADPIGAGEWREVTVDDISEAYFAVQQASSATGLLVARRVDKPVV